MGEGAVDLELTDWVPADDFTLVVAVQRGVRWGWEEVAVGFEARQGGGKEYLL